MRGARIHASGDAKWIGWGSRTRSRLAPKHFMPGDALLREVEKCDTFAVEPMAAATTDFMTALQKLPIH
jgi:hypothetical protein